MFAFANPNSDNTITEATSASMEASIQGAQEPQAVAQSASEAEEAPAHMPEKTPEAKGVDKTKRRTESWSTDINKILKLVHPDDSISQEALLCMDSFINDVLERIAGEASKLAQYNEKNTISSRDIQTAVRLILRGELATHAVSAGTKAVTQGAKAGSFFSIGRVERLLGRGKHSSRIGGGAPVYLAAVAEHLAAEILELAGNAARDEKQARITPRLIQLAVGKDQDLNNLLGGVTDSSGFV